jgi:hypothetical protein
MRSTIEHRQDSRNDRRDNDAGPSSYAAAARARRHGYLQGGGFAWALAVQPRATHSAASFRVVIALAPVLFLLPDATECLGRRWAASMVNKLTCYQKLSTTTTRPAPRRGSESVVENQ